MIPEIKLQAVKKALKETFGVDEWSDIKMLTGGLSGALVFKIIVKDNPYLLRIITKTDAMNDPTRQFYCMKLASDAGIAPRIWYTSIEDRILIADYIDSRPFPDGQAKIYMSETLQKLHSLPHFPKLANYLDTVDNFVNKFKSLKILPHSITDELFEKYELIKKIYPYNDEDLVSCHNDLKPENIMFDGERSWLIDWESAFLNDPYTDLCVVANFVVKDDKDEIDYLQRYFAQELDEYKYARFFLMSQIVHIFYFTFFMIIASQGKSINVSKSNFTFRDFHSGILKGEISLDTNEYKIQYALTHLEKALHDMRKKKFEDSLNIVSCYHKM